MKNTLLLGAILFLSAGFVHAQSEPQSEDVIDLHLPNAASSTPTPATETVNVGSYRPITPAERMQWFAKGTIGPQSLAVGVFSSGLGTARNVPPEYGGSWDGFGKRYGMRLTGVATGNAMEAGFGAIWGEDPRYFRTSHQAFRGRIQNVVAMTFLAHGRDGRRMPAYARYIATPGNNFLSNTWRVDSDATTQAALVRTMWGFVGVMGKNAFNEFWPDVQRKIFHRKR